jgi:tricorn protease
VRHAALVLLLLLATPAPAAERRPFLQQPAVSRTEVAFVYANQVWIAPRGGGVARRLTQTAGVKADPRFSPDGKRIAFTANEARNLVNVFTMPVSGGAAERITYLPERQVLRQWTGDGRLLFAAGALSFSRIERQLFTVDARGGLPVRLPVAYGGEGELDATGTLLAYTPQWPNTLMARWAKYRGGMAPEIRLLHLRTGASEAITDWRGIDTRPMWHGSTVYYLSDAGPEQRLNLWSYDTRTRARRQHTRFADHDVRNPSMGPDAIAFEQAGDVHLFDLRRGTSSRVELTIPERAPRFRRVDAAKFITHRDGGLIEARGDLWLDGVNLTATSGAFEREASLSPDGQWLAFSSDASGEYQLYLRSKNGKAEQLTGGAGSFRHRPLWSPDSRRFAFSDRRGSVFIGDVVDKRVAEIDRDPWAELSELAWSADSRRLFYTRTGDNHLTALWRYELESGERHPLTSGRFNDMLPAVDPNGAHLFYVSFRNFSIPATDWLAQRIVHRATGVLMAVPLAGPLEWAEIERRAFRVGATPGSISALSVTKDGNPRYTLTDGTGATSVRIYDLRAKKEEVAPEEKPAETPKLEVEIDLHAEWRQLFLDAWRRFRDYFYAPNARPVDWDDVRRRYEPLAARCDTREELNEVVAGMIGESGVGHAYISHPGDTVQAPADPAATPGLLGADFSAGSGAFRIDRIHHGAPWDDTARSPLAGVKEGELLLAVDGKPADVSRDVRVAFLGTVGKPVTIRVGASAATARDIVVTPVASETDLRYRAWVEENRLRVERAGAGRIGYVHLPTFTTNAVNEMARQLYGQIDADALIIDARWSDGGWTGAILTEMLDRTPLNYAASRETGRLWPAQRWGAHFGPKALVVNHMVASAGENFAYYFRKTGLGPIVGARTWGGLTGLNPVPALIDGGAVSVPNAPFFDETGWLIEGHGIETDVNVEDDPARRERGEDAQLDAAIAAMLKAIAERPYVEPPVPPANEGVGGGVVKPR